MRRSDCMTLGEFRKLTDGLPDSTCLLVVSTQTVGEALALMPYPYDTCLHDTFLFEAKTDDCVRFEDC